MAQVRDDLKPLVAQAAAALEGHLGALALLNVDGLPAPTVRRPAAGPAPGARKTVTSSAPTAAPANPAPASASSSPASRAWSPPGAAGAPTAPRAPARAPRVMIPESAGIGAPVSRPEVPPSPAARAAPPANPVATATPPPPAVAVAAPPPVSPVMGSPTDPLPDVPRGAPGLQVLRDDIGDCKRCKLHSRRTNIVFGVGSATAEIAFVGEGPGADEDQQGEPFVGKAGQLLTQMIKAMGYEREQVYICNVVKCRPPNNRDPEPDEVAACSPFLLRQLAAVRPQVIVTLGKHAAHTLLGVKTPITRLRGTWSQWHGVPLMPTFHPSYLLRDPAQKKYAWEDLKAVLRQLGRSVPEARR